MKKIILIIASVILLAWSVLFVIGNGWVDIRIAKDGLHFEEGLSQVVKDLSPEEFRRLCILRGIKIE